MKPRWMPLILGVALLPLSLPPSARAQDDWSITRERKAAPRGAHHRGRARRPRATPRASGSEKPASRDRTDVLIARYRGVLRAHPGDSFALHRLLDLYRDRDGNIDALVHELEQERASHPDAFGARLVLGEIYELSQRSTDARKAYEEASALRPSEPAPLVALARIRRDANELDAARGLLERALAHTTQDADREALLRQLGEIALQQKDYDAARGYYDKLARGAKSSIYLRTEYARALSAHGEHQRAVQEYQRVLKALGGDNRVLPPVLRDLAKAQLAAGDANAAIQTLGRALRLAPARSGIRHEIYEVMLDAYRRDNRLDELADRLSKEAHDFEGYELLGRVHDELGHEEQAQAAYRHALRLEPHDIDTRVRLIQLLSRSGRLDDVIAEYRALIRVAPGEPRFVVELAQLLMQVGKRDEAMRLAAETSRKYPRSAAVHQSLAELYGRWGEDVKATAEVKALVRIDPHDPSHMVVLGAQQLAAGNRQAAVATWRRILAADPDKAHGEATLGGVFADHDMLDEAEHAYREAVRLEPDQLDYVRGLANVLERPREHESASERRERDAEAAKWWRRVLDLAKDDQAARREARDRIVAIAQRANQLSNRIDEWKTAFEADPPDLSAGRFLAEAYLRQQPRRLAEAQRVLERIVSLAPGDVESLSELERVLTQQGNLVGAIGVLKKLVQADPRKAPQYLQRMAEHALSLYRDKDAVRYAEMAVQRTPDDAEAHKRLGDLYRARQDIDHAIASYRRAIALDPRLYPTYVELAELYLAHGDMGRADRLLREVMRASPDEDLVARATRESIQIHLGAGTLPDLERDLLPLALSHPRHPVYRRLLVELYDAMARPWVRQVEEGGPQADAARGQLRALGRRGIKPLLEALADTDPVQQRIAVSLLGHLGNANAAGPLLAAAEGQGEVDLRARALAAAGALASPDLAPRFIELAKGPERRLRATAAWSLARIGGRRAVSAMRDLLDHPDPAVRAFATMGLGLAGDRGSAEAIAVRLREDRNTYVQAAAAWSLGRLGGQGHVPALVVALRGPSGLVSRAAAGALGRIGGGDALHALAEALFDPEPLERDAAAQAMAHAAGGRGAAAGAASTAPLVMPDPAAPPGAYVTRLIDREQNTPTQPVNLAPLQDDLRAAASDALRGPLERVLAALDALTPRGDGVLAMGSLTASMSQWPPAARRAADRVLSQIAGSLVPDLVELVRHPDPKVREAAVRLVARIDGPAPARALDEALSDQETSVQRAALSVLQAPHARLDPNLVGRAAELLGHPDWSVRTEAARALGRMGSPAAVEPLTRALNDDGYAFVRLAAVDALGRIGGPAARAALQRASDHDPEPRVRQAAGAALAHPSSD